MAPKRPEVALMRPEFPVFVGNFDISPPDRFANKPAPPYQQPTEVSCFSFDGFRNLFLDDRTLRFFAMPNQSVPLSRGFESYITRDLAAPEHLDSLLLALHTEKLLSRAAPTPANRRRMPNFVTWRGVLTKLFSVVYDRREPFELWATLFNGTIYLVENELESKRERERNMSGQDALWAYGGYKFEALCNLPVPEAQATGEMLDEREKAVVNNNEQYCAVLKTRFGEDLIYMGAEVDCATTIPKAGSTDAYLELKTNRIISNERQQKAFGTKLMKIYLQSFLAGIPKVIVGFRDDDHLVQEIREFETLDIPVMTRGQVEWDPNVIMSFGAAVLEFLKRNIRQDHPSVVYSVKADRDGKKLVINELPENMAKPFLPEWLRKGEDPPIPGS